MECDPRTGGCVDYFIDASVDLSVIGRMEVCENLRGANLAALVCRC